MNIIFDFDGTICDSTEKAIEIINEFLAKNKKEPISKKGLRENGIKKIIKSRRISPLQLPKLVLLGRKIVSPLIPSLNIFPDLPQVITRLSKKHKLGIITSNSKENVIEFLDEYKIYQDFTFVDDELDLFGKAKKLKKVIRKYSLTRKDTFYVGDETRDVEAAKKVGIKSVAVTWGFESKELLEKAKPDIIVSKPADLLKIWT